MADAVERIAREHFDGTLSHQRDWAVVDRYDRWTIAAMFADCLTAACGQATEGEREWSRPRGVDISAPKPCADSEAAAREPVEIA